MLDLFPVLQQGVCESAVCGKTDNNLMEICGLAVQMGRAHRCQQVGGLKRGYGCSRDDANIDDGLISFAPEMRNPRREFMSRDHRPLWVDCTPNKNPNSICDTIMIGEKRGCGGSLRGIIGCLGQTGVVHNPPTGSVRSVQAGRPRQ